MDNVLLERDDESEKLEAKAKDSFVTTTASTTIVFCNFNSQYPLFVIVY